MPEMYMNFFFCIALESIITPHKKTAQLFSGWVVFFVMSCKQLPLCKFLQVVANTVHC